VSAIETQTAGQVTVEYSDNDTRLKLYDHTSGDAHFKVDNAAGSKATVDTRDLDGDGNTSELLFGPITAAMDLGIYGEIVPGDDPDAPIAPDQLEGGRLGGIDPLERLFLRNAQAAATLSVSTPQLDEDGNVADTDSDGSTEDGLNASARFGFVGIAVALMGRNHPVGIVLAAVLFGALYQGGSELSFDMPTLSRDLVVVIQGLVILFAGALEHMFRPAVQAMLATLAPGAAGMNPTAKGS